MDAKLPLTRLSVSIKETKVGASRKTPEPQKLNLFKQNNPASTKAVAQPATLFKAEKKTLKPIPEKVKSVYNIKGPKAQGGNASSQASSSVYKEVGVAKRSASNLSSGSGQSNSNFSSGSSAFGSIQSGGNNTSSATTNKNPYTKVGPR